MENVRLIVRNLIDESTLTVTDSATPIESVQQTRRTKWRSATNNTQVITGALANTAFANGISLAHHNLLAGAQWRIVLKKDAAIVYDSEWMGTVLYIPAGRFKPGVTPWMANYNSKLPVQMCVHWFNTHAFNSYEIHLKPSPAADYSEVGRIFLGEAISPDINMNEGCELTYVERGKHRDSAAGGLWTIGKGVSRKFEFDLQYLDAIQRNELALELVSAGLESDLLISAYPGRGDVLELEHTIIGKRMDSFATTHVDYDEFRTRLGFIEA